MPPELDHVRTKRELLAERAWIEAETGEIGPATVELVHDKIDLVRRFDGYPPPEDFDEWDAAAIETVGQDYFAAREPDKRFRVIHAGASDAKSFANRVKTSVRNYMRDNARTTETGRVIRSLEHHIGNDDAVVTQGAASVTKTWSLALHAANMPYTGPIEPLVEAAFAVPNVELAAWSPEARRRAPLAEPESLGRVI